MSASPRWRRWTASSALTAAFGRPGLGAWCAGATASTAVLARLASADTPVLVSQRGKAIHGHRGYCRPCRPARCALDDRIEALVPALPAGRARSPLRQLLTHTGGLPVHGASRTGRLRAEEQIAAAARSLLPAACPGSAWSHSNVGYMMLGPHRRRRSSGRALGDVLR